MNPSISGFEYENITAIGTTVIRNKAATLHTIIPEVSVGTILLHDTATKAGTAASNLVYSFAGGTSVQDCFTRILDIQFKNGITAVHLGTPVALLSIS